MCDETNPPQVPYSGGMPVRLRGRTIATRGGIAIMTSARKLDIGDLRARVAAYEDRYGVPSERMFDAFTVDGELRETAEFQDWLFLYETAQDATARCYV